MTSRLFAVLARRFELARATSGTNLRVMEGMRGFAVTLVFLTHFFTLLAPSLVSTPGLANTGAAIHAMGNSGVDFFFLLSGYLIYKTLVERKQNFFRFMWRRVSRIYPAFLAVFAVYWGLSFVFPGENKIPDEAPLLYIVENLLLLPGLFPITPMITVAWSLSYEMFFYLCLPVFVAALDLRRRSSVFRLCAIAGAALLIAGYCIAFDDNKSRLLMFIAGMLVHETMGIRQLNLPSGRVAVWALLAGLAGASLPVPAYAKLALLFGGFYLVCISCFVNPQESLGRVFSWTPLRWLGNMSYSYYLLHGLTLKALFMVLSKTHLLSVSPWLMCLILLPVFFLVSLVTSAGLFLLIEKPFSLAVPKPQAIVQPGVVEAN